MNPIDDDETLAVSIDELIAEIAVQQDRFRALGYPRAIVRVEIALAGFSAGIFSLEPGPFNPNISKSLSAVPTLGEIFEKIRATIGDFPLKWTDDDVAATIGIAP